ERRVDELVVLPGDRCDPSAARNVPDLGLAVEGQQEQLRGIRAELDGPRTEKPYVDPVQTRSAVQVPDRDLEACAVPETRQSPRRVEARAPRALAAPKAGEQPPAGWGESSAVQPHRVGRPLQLQHHLAVGDLPDLAVLAIAGQRKRAVRADGLDHLLARIR